jgi:hypothetical protein
MVTVNSVTFDRDRYATDEAMWADIGRLLQILTYNNCVCKVQYEDCGITIVEFETSNKPDYLGVDELVWLDAEEVEIIENYRANKE